MEENRGIKHNDINASKLLEEGNEDGHCEVRPVLLLQEISPGVLNELGGLTGGYKVLEFFFNVVDTSDSPQLGFGCLVLPTLDHGVGCVREDKGTDGDDESRDDGAPQAQPPSPATLYLCKEVVQYIGHKDTDCDG